MDVLFNGKLLIGPDSKLNLAAEEGVKLKHLCSAVRSLWRSSPTGNHPHVTHLKALLRPSPERLRRRASESEEEEVDSNPPRDEPEAAADEASAADEGDEGDASDACSVLSASTLELPGRGEDGDDAPVEHAMTDVDSDAAMDEGEDGKSAIDEMLQGDSQRPGAWLGNTIALFNRLEKTGKMVVPVHVLYEWLVDGKPAETGEYGGTFYVDDLEYLPICL